MTVRRREFISLLGGALAASPLVAQAQPDGRVMRTVVVLMGTTESDPDQRALVSVFTQALAERGWRDGANVHVEYRWANGDIARVRDLTVELARLAPEAIFTSGTAATMALRQAAPVTPIVFVNVTDPVGTGLVSSLAHPAGKITGFTNYEFSMGGKWLDILKDIAPGIGRVAVVFNPDNPAHTGVLHSIKAAGRGSAIQVVARPARNDREFERAISAAASEGSVGLLVLWDYLTLAHRELIIELANRYRLPAGYGVRAFAASGGLFSYGVDFIDLFRRSASYVDQILKGVRPADLPVQQPTKFELVINLKTAKVLGLTPPPTLLATADEVIE